MATKIIRFTAASLKETENDIEFDEFRDERYPLRLRLHKNRKTGSWYLVRSVNGKQKKEKLGNYPSVKLKDILSNLSNNLMMNIAKPENEFKTFGDLLTWYQNRSNTRREISVKRKTSIQWAIRKHLLPLIADLKLDEVTPGLIDKKFFQPIQQQYSLSTAQNIWIVLKQAVNQATQLILIEPNPISHMEFRDFVKPVKTASRPGLKYRNVSQLFIDAKSASIPARALVLIMLLHGTRIGETRQAKWEDFCFHTDMWSVPATTTKTRVELNLPITPIAQDVLIDYRQWQEENGYTGAYLFPAPKQKACINEIAADDLIQDVSQGQWTSHQIRKFTRTTMVDLKVDFLVAELILNHKLTKVTAAYIHTDATEEKRIALNTYHNWLVKEFRAINNLINVAIV